MSKKKYVVIFMVIVIGLVCFAGCKSGEPVKKVEETTGEIFGFNSHLAIKKGDDGWLYYFMCEEIKGTEEPYSYTFNGYNLKYKQIEDCVVEILDENNNVVGTQYANLPYISSDDTYAADFDNIRNFFYTTRPTTALTEEQVSELNIISLDKEMVVDLYNEAIQSHILDEGKYYYLPQSDIVQERTRNGYCWQVGFFIVQGTIVDVNIELIYSDNVYLSDLVAEGKADDSQKAIDNIIVDIEKEIMEKQSFEVKDISYSSSTIDYKRLNNILRDIEKGSYK